MTVFEMSNIAQNNLSEMLNESNQLMDLMPDNNATVNLNGTYMFQDEESMDALLNKIGLIVQRKGGK